MWQNRSFVRRAGALGFLIGLISATSQANADQVAGDHEAQLAGGAFYAQGNDTGTAQGDISYGYYWTPAWQIGISQALSYSINNDTEDVWTGSTLPFVNYHFRGATTDRRFQPFVGAFLGIGYSDVDLTGSVGPQLGAKYFISDQIFVSARYRYEFYFDDLDMGAETDDFSDGNHAILLGFGFVWGGQDRGR